MLFSTPIHYPMQRCARRSFLFLCVVLVLFAQFGIHVEAAPSSKSTSSKKSSLKLFQQLRHPSAAVRLKAVLSLAKLGVKARPYFMTLSVMMKTDTSQDVRFAAGAVCSLILLREGKLAVGLLRSLSSPSRETRWMAIHGLASSGPKAIPGLRKALQHKNAKVRSGAAKALGMMGRPGGPAVPRLIHLLKDSSWEVRSAAAEALGQIRLYPKQVVPALIPLLNDSFLVASPAATALGHYKGKAASAVPTLLRLLAKPNCHPCTTVAMTLGYIGPAALPLMLQRLKTTRSVQELTGLLGAFGKMKQRAAPVIKNVVQLLLHPNKDVRSAAAMAIWDINVPNAQAVNALRKTMKDSDEYVRANSARALSSMGKQAAIALPELRHALHDSSFWVVREAIVAIGKIGKKAAPAIPQLLRVLRQSPSVYARQNAAQALGRMGCPTKSAANGLLAALQDKSSWVRHWAVDALLTCKAKKKRVIAAVKRLLHDSDPSVVRSARKALRAWRAIP